MRSSVSFPLQPILLLAGIVILLRLVALVAPGTPLLRPELVGAALFLYSPFLYYRGGRKVPWIRVTDVKRSIVLLVVLGGGGAAAFYLASALSLLPSPPSHGGNLSPFGAFVFRQALLVALPEEVFFRGYLYDALEEKGWEPVSATSLLFAACHLAIHASPYRALTFFPALLFGWGRRKSGNIYVPALLHLLFNLLPHLPPGA